MELRRRETMYVTESIHFHFLLKKLLIMNPLEPGANGPWILSCDRAAIVGLVYNIGQAVFSAEACRGFFGQDIFGVRPD